MNTTTSKKRMLHKIKQALRNSVPVPFPEQQNDQPIYQPAQESLDVVFAEQFTQLQGKFIFCNNVAEMKMSLQQLLQKEKWNSIFCSESALLQIFNQQGFPATQTNDLPNCDVSITTCEALVARTGSMVLSAAQSNGRTASVYAPIHICIAYTNQLVYDVKDALLFMQEKYKESLPSLITFATGPSRTADIEKTLVVGVHGPKEVYVFLVDEINNNKI